MRYLVKMNDIDDYAAQLDNINKFKVATKIQELKDVTKMFEWNSEAQRAYLNKYNSIVNKLDVIPKMLDAYIKFFGVVTGNHKEIVKQMKPVFKELEDEDREINNKINNNKDALINELKQLKNSNPDLDFSSIIMKGIM